MVVRLLHYKKPIEPKYEYATVYRRDENSYSGERDIFRFYSKDKVPKKHIKFMEKHEPTSTLNGVFVWDLEEIEEQKGIRVLI